MADAEERLIQLLDKIDELEDEIGWLIRAMNEERLYLIKVMPENDIATIIGMTLRSHGRKLGILAIKHDIYLKKSLPDNET